jgi:thiosulfate/3-mercaptopyruvate sulfurtransferase
MTTTPLPGPLVSAGWLAAHLGEPGLVVVDASWYLAAMQRDPRAEHAAAHIPGAVFWDLDELSDRGSPLPHMLPDPAALERSLRALGLSAGDRIVVYDGSGTNLSAPRVWWTLRAAGHDAVAVLDGGFAAWRGEGHPVESGAVRRPEGSFIVRFRSAMVRSMVEVSAQLARGGAVVADARARGRFEGTEPEPRPGLRGGHIPGAKNLPFTDLVAPDGRLLPVEELRRRFDAAGIPADRPVILSCGSGVTACALGLGLELLGRHDWAVYDGSWTEWGAADGPPIETGPSLP